MLNEKEIPHNLPEVGKLYRLCVEIKGKRFFQAFELDLERNLLVCIPPTVMDHTGPMQSFLISGSGEIFRWCFMADEKNLLRVGMENQFISSLRSCWLEEVDLSFAEQ